jgi:hypothetical protein
MHDIHQSLKKHCSSRTVFKQLTDMLRIQYRTPLLAEDAPRPAGTSAPLDMVGQGQDSDLAVESGTRHRSACAQNRRTWQHCSKTCTKESHHERWTTPQRAEENLVASHSHLNTITNSGPSNSIQRRSASKCSNEPLSWKSKYANQEGPCQWQATDSNK